MGRGEHGGGLASWLPSTATLETDDLIDVIEEIEEAPRHAPRAVRVRPARPPRRPRAGPGAPWPVSSPTSRAWASGRSTTVARTTIPIELATLVSLVDNEPRLRRVVENVLERVGPPTITLATVNAAAQGLAQGPLGLVVDGLQRATTYTESTARRRRWELIESQLHGEPTGRWVDPHDDEPRPVTAPGGPVETFTDRAALASLAGAATAGLTTGNPRTAAAVLMAGVPKAAKVGRETFAGHLGRMLADRGVVVTDSSRRCAASTPSTRSASRPSCSSAGRRWSNSSCSRAPTTSRCAGACAPSSTRNRRSS